MAITVKRRTPRPGSSSISAIPPRPHHNRAHHHHAERVCRAAGNRPSPLSSNGRSAGQHITPTTAAVMLFARRRHARGRSRLLGWWCFPDRAPAHGGD